MAETLRKMGDFLSRHDREGMYEKVLMYPTLFSDGLTEGKKIAEKIPDDWPFEPGNVVFCGVGGSAIPGEFISETAVAHGVSVPMFVWRRPGLPPWTKKDSLVVVTSYSGNTVESIESFIEAKRRGLKTVAVSSGGRLSEMAAKSGVPVLRLPTGIPPRACLPAMVGSLLSFLSSGAMGEFFLSLKEIDAGGVEKTLLDVTKKISVENIQDNPSFLLVDYIGDRIPLFFGEGYTAPVARRGANQFNENAKTISLWFEIPEASHNLLEALMAVERWWEVFAPIYLSQAGEREKDRYSDLLSSFFEKEGMPGHVFVPEGASPLEKMLSASAVLDMASVYHGVLRGVNPSPVLGIARWKEFLGDVGSQ